MPDTTKLSKQLDYEPRYSGELGVEFWKRVNALTKSPHVEVYALGRALQDLERRTLAALNYAERRRR